MHHVWTNVTLDHRTSHRVKVFEIEMYTLGQYCILIEQYFAEMQLSENHSSQTKIKK